MLGSEFDIYNEKRRSNWVRLRTLVALRWSAVLGQSLAILVATRAYDLVIDLGAAALVIGATVVTNLYAVLRFPQNRRLTEREAAAVLVFDILQLGLLLYLTGGIGNPFALLLLAPVAIAATVLPLRPMIGVALLAMLLITCLSQFSRPLVAGDGTLMALPDALAFGYWVSLNIGVVFLAIYARQVTSEINVMGEALLATQLAFAREQKLTDLGGVVAAAAHELGTPLATIKLASNELADELRDDPELHDDAILIREQAERCRVILNSMGRVGKDDPQMHHAPVQSVIEEAAAPHTERGKTVTVRLPADTDTRHQPVIQRGPAIVHGLRNLIQNAVDFAQTEVILDVSWTDDRLIVRILDDGPGFPPSIINRIGDPFVRRRRGALDSARRPGYEGMGLGLFIAKTLLERSGATLAFGNRPAGEERVRGAEIHVSWYREALEATGRPLGPNLPLTLS